MSSSSAFNVKALGPVQFRFAVIADSHLNPEASPNTSPWQTNHQANPRNEVVVAAINKIGVDFTVHVGDVVHPLPHTDEYDAAARYALGLYAKLDSAFYIAPGNHDIGDKCLPGNPAASITQTTCDAYERHFGPQWQSFMRDGCCFVLINACLMGSGSDAESRQWQWLETTLSEAQSRRVFLFTHYPPFITAPDEENNYDNIDQKPRRKLLRLIEDTGVEACFAGHVHTFFLNRIGSTLSYALPSSTNFRQDYAEIFHADPKEELGRNDTGKFGFFLVEVHEQSHVARFVRTDGKTDLGGVEEIVAQIGADIRSTALPTAVVNLCHDWTGVTHLPFNAPLDTFMRKAVRNDYIALNLWDCAIRSARIPMQDIVDTCAYERVVLLAAMGHQFVVFTRAPLDLLQSARLAAIASSIIAIEFVCEPTAKSIARLHASLPFGFAALAYFAPYYSPSESTDPSQPSAPYDHTMKCGFSVDQIDLIQRFKLDLPVSVAGAGVVIRIDVDQPVTSAIESISRSLPSGLKAMAEVCLAPRKSFTYSKDTASTVARVTNAALAAARYPDLIVRIDTFMDIDRGYFPRNGLVDRYHNPTDAGRATKSTFDRLAPSFRLFEPADETTYQGSI